MSDPNLEPLPEDLLDLIERANRSAVDPQQLASIRHGVDRALAVRALSLDTDATGADGAAATAATATKATLVGSKLLLLGSTLAALAIGGGVGYQAGKANAPAAPVTAVAPIPRASASEAAEEPDLVVPPASTTSAASKPPAPAEPRTAPSASAPTGRNLLRQERELIDAAGAALRAGHPEEALALGGRHQRDFGHGQLAEEREALAIRALVALGRGAEAQSRQARFRAAFPSSPLLPGLEKLVTP